MKYRGGRNSNRRNLLTYFPVGPTRTCPIPWSLQRWLLLIRLACLQQSRTWRFVSWMSLTFLMSPLQKDRREQDALYSPKEGCFSGIPPPHPNQNIVISSKQQWWVTMYNQENTHNEQLSVVSIVFCSLFSKELLIL